MAVEIAFAQELLWLRDGVMRIVDATAVVEAGKRQGVIPEAFAAALIEELSTAAEPWRQGLVQANKAIGAHDSHLGLAGLPLLAEWAELLALVGEFSGRLWDLGARQAQSIASIWQSHEGTRSFAEECAELNMILNGAMGRPNGVQWIMTGKRATTDLQAAGGSTDDLVNFLDEYLAYQDLAGSLMTMNKVKPLGLHSDSFRATVTWLMAETGKYLGEANVLLRRR